MKNGKKVLDNKGFGGAVLIDLSKALNQLNTINHDLLIAKLPAYDFDKSSLKIPFSYLTYLIESTEVRTFADDTTFFADDKDLNSLIKRLEHDNLLAIEWFQNNNIKLNHNKCQLLVCGYKHENFGLKLEMKQFGKVVSKCY